MIFQHSRRTVSLQSIEKPSCYVSCLTGSVIGDLNLTFDCKRLFDRYLKTTASFHPKDNSGCTLLNSAKMNNTEVFFITIHTDFESFNSRREISLHFTVERGDMTGISPFLNSQC